MNMFQRNLEHFYSIVKAKEFVNRAKFARMLNISRGTLFRLIKGESPSISFDKAKEFTNAFNQYTGLDVGTEEFMEIDLAEKYPLKNFYQTEPLDEANLFKMLRSVRKISLREAERLSRRLFADDKDAQLSATYLMRLERGDYKSPSLKKLKTMATLYRVPIELFVTSKSMSLIQEIGSKLIIDLDRIDAASRLKFKKEVYQLLGKGGYEEPRNEAIDIAGGNQ